MWRRRRGYAQRYVGGTYVNAQPSWWERVKKNLSDGAYSMRLGLGLAGSMASLARFYNYNLHNRYPHYHLE